MVSATGVSAAIGMVREIRIQAKLKA